MTNKEILAQMEKALQLRNYSRKTIKAYIGHLRRLVLHYSKNIPETVCAKGLFGEDIPKTMYIIIELGDTYMLDYAKQERLLIHRSCFTIMREAYASLSIYQNIIKTHIMPLLRSPKIGGKGATHAPWRLGQGTVQALLCF